MYFKDVPLPERKEGEDSVSVDAALAYAIARGDVLGALRTMTELGLVPKECTYPKLRQALADQKAKKPVRSVSFCVSVCVFCGTGFFSLTQPTPPPLSLFLSFSHSEAPGAPPPRRSAYCTQ